MQNIVLGAGVTGLACGYKHGYPIYEATNAPGGICTSYIKDGFDFSVGGGHWLFENEKTIPALDLVKSLVSLKSYERKAGIYYNTIFPYPIQTFSEKPNEYTPGYFKEWLAQKFSNDMCNMFFYPFNEKYTAGLYDEIIQFDSYKTPKAGSLGFVSRFHDPIGGLGGLIDKLALKCQLRLNKRAIRIDWENKIVIFQDGETVKYEKLISTIPLDQVLKLCQVQDKDFNLPYSSVFVLNLGAIPGKACPKEHWLYIPFSNVGFYRVGFYSNVDPSKAPDGKVGLSVEMAFPSSINYDNIDVSALSEKIISELMRWNWIEYVTVVDPTWVKCAYTWNRTVEERGKWLDWLKERNIVSTGRYGKWKFQGMLESMMDGINAV